MSFVTNMQADTTAILTDWQETLTVKRSSKVYGAAGMATETWATQGTFSGHWQPVSGSVIRAEQGLEVKSDAMIVTATSIDVLAGDQIYRADGSFEYVHYVKAYKGHTTIFLTKTQGSN
jgi:hypothetical protein